MLSRKKTAKSVRIYQNNAIKKDQTGGHTTIKTLLYEEIKKIPGWGIDKHVGKKLVKNVSAYVKRRHPYIYNTNFLVQGEEKSARKTIREYLYRYILEGDTDDSDHSDLEEKAGMTIEEQDEELGALIAIDEKELDYTSLLEAKIGNPEIVDFVSEDLNDVIKRLNKLGQKLSSIEPHLRSYVTGLKRLKFAFKNAVPVVGSRKVHFVENDDLFNQIDDASRDLMEKYFKEVPLSFTFPGVVDGKAYIIATVNLPRGSLVYNLPSEFKNFPLLIDYGTMRASTASDEYRKYQNLKPGISISNSELGGAFTLGAFFKATKEPDKKYLLTVSHGVGEGNLAQHYCAKVTKYKDLSIDTSGRLLDFAFCEVDNHRGALANNRPCQSNIIIEDIESTLDHKVGSNILVQKVGRTTGHTLGKMRNLMSRILTTNTFEEETYANMLLVISGESNFGASGDSGAVYDQDGHLWGIYQSTSESGSSSAVVPIDLILERIHEKESIEFELME
ncbi:hypothetical protein RhiirC2_754017 [Rhizophagus irregularis]|uniref:Uncharacterized protein n=1 Tax=Rhizophagus irregularis TaxID=588596 RepID=A0A2N1MX07_9GLOM|nr:hypothetical protein RhiirC2_754017 [Rhizophagus irregularis]